MNKCQQTSDDTGVQYQMSDAQSKHQIIIILSLKQKPDFACLEADSRRHLSSWLQAFMIPVILQGMMLHVLSTVVFQA